MPVGSVRLRAGAIAAALVAPMLAAFPATAAVAAPTVVAPAAACAVSDGSLSWGFKESFRSYISGTIAKGAWEPINGATYETPEFGWSAATGTFDPQTLTGDVAFTGGVHFTGHNGLLDTTIAGPTLSFTPDGGTLMLDVQTVSMDDAMAGNTDNVQSFTQVPMVTLDLATVPLSSDGTVITGTAVPTAVTQEGFDAFGSYEAGTPFDAVTFSFTVACATPEPEPEMTTMAEPEVTVTPISAESDAGVSPALWFAIGGGVVAALIATFTSIVVARRKKAAGAGETGE